MNYKKELLESLWVGFRVLSLQTRRASERATTFGKPWMSSGRDSSKPSTSLIAGPFMASQTIPDSVLLYVCICVYVCVYRYIDR